MPKGTLYLIPVPLAEGSVAKAVPPLHHTVINNLRHYIVENEKTARHWLKAMQLEIPQSELKIQVYGKHSEKISLAEYFTDLESGRDVGLMSEAGCPAVADPGSDLVAEAHRRGINVVPLVGPSSIMLALMASGFNGQSFAFYGYLPIDKVERSRRIKELESLSDRLRQTQIFIETPFRNNQLLEEVLRSCNPSTMLCVAVNLTGEDEEIHSASIANWRKRKADFHKKPAIFLIHKR
ncbi:MAG: SAM-dependent methyltransferase [Sphingobacteriaceae bacterium]|jgi:16S rRNA (cytidine1402-2'-O)-methyltransferase|nr:SAM-dependent methyltransferase [Sphingobacteriaceae bacterium]